MLLSPNYLVCQAQEYPFHMEYENGGYLRTLSSIDDIPNYQSA